MRNQPRIQLFWIYHMINFKAVYNTHTMVNKLGSLRWTRLISLKKTVILHNS